MCSIPTNIKYDYNYTTGLKIVKEQRLNEPL